MSVSWSQPSSALIPVGASAAVAAALNRAGWTARNLAGGMEAWAAAGLPVVDQAGGAGLVI